MNIQEAKEEIIRTIQAYTARNAWGGCRIPLMRQRPVFLIGPPGIGKTAIMAQAAARCSVSFVSYSMSHHTRQSAFGLPLIRQKRFGEREYSITEYTMSEIIASVYQAIEESGCPDGLLFLDEVNCVSETLAPAMLQFLQTKTFGSHRLPEGWVLAAAGNPPEYNKSVREFDLATLDRLKYISVEASYDAWRSYALENKIHGAILSYLDLHPDRFFILEQNRREKTFVTARGWEDLSCLLLLYEELSLPVNAALIFQYLHMQELAQDFDGFYHWFCSRAGTLCIPGLLSGCEKDIRLWREQYAACSFEELLQVTHLLLSFLLGRLSSWFAQQSLLKEFSQASDRLKRFFALQSGKKECPDLLNAVPAWLEQEQEVLRVRRRHHLSAEEELDLTRQLLFEIQNLASRFRCAQTGAALSGPQSFEEALAQEALAKETALHADGVRLLSQMEQAVALFLPAQDCGSLEFSSRQPADFTETKWRESAFTLFLSSLFENRRTQEFLKQYPSALCEQARGRLDFDRRKAQIRQLLKPPGPGAGNS